MALRIRLLVVLIRRLMWSRRTGLSAVRGMFLRMGTRLKIIPFDSVCLNWVVGVTEIWSILVMAEVGDISKDCYSGVRSK